MTVMVDANDLRTILRDIVAASGSLGEEPDLVASNLVHANLTGHDSHGVGMLPRYIRCLRTGELKANQHAEIITDKGCILVVDGHAGYGQVIGREAMDLGIERARSNGVCVLAIRRSFHLGRIGAWGERCAASGLVSMHHVNVVGHDGIVAPFGGSDGRYSTNPYCCALPAAGNTPAVVLDFATSVMAHGKIRVARNKGERLPEGVLLDRFGQPTCDPNDLFTKPTGAILPFGGYKGYGLALINELLAGVLSGGGTCRPETNSPNDTVLNNMLSVIIDPSRLVSPEWYDAETDTTLAYVKASPPRNPEEPLLIPGEPERLLFAERSRHGIPIDNHTWPELLQTARDLGLDPKHIKIIAA